MQLITKDIRLVFTDYVAIIGENLGSVISDNLVSVDDATLVHRFRDRTAKKANSKETACNIEGGG